MKTFAVLSVAALMGFGALAPSAAQARGGGALAAGLIGGVAAGALIGAAISEAHAGPAAYGYASEAPVVYRPTRFVRSYEEEAPAYRTRRFDAYDPGPVGYGYRPVAHRGQPNCDRETRYGNW